jgi:tetratricopeptide (TPR) repeat protein
VLRRAVHVAEASIYAKLLREKMDQHQARCVLLNTGWSGGPYGKGKRISIKDTRALLNAALRGDLHDGKTTYAKHPVFGLKMPSSCPGVDAKILDPSNTWGTSRLRRGGDEAPRHVPQELRGKGLRAARHRARDVMSTPIEHYKQGLALYGGQKNEEAAAEFRKALELKPDWLDAMHALATVQSKLGKPGRGARDDRARDRARSEDPFAYTSQSIFLQRKGLVPEAEAASAKARMAAWKKELKTNPKAPPPADAGGMSVVQ